MTQLTMTMFVLTWVVMIPLAIMTAVLFRQLGILVMGSARGIEDGGIPLGKKLPKTSLIAVGGEQWHPEQWANKPFLVFFAGTYCSECRGLLPMLREIHGAGLRVVTFLFADDASEASQYVTEHDLPGTVIYTDQKLGRLYDVDTVPFVYSIGSNGGVMAKGIGGSPAKLAVMAAALGVDVAVPEAPTGPIVQLGSV